MKKITVLFLSFFFLLIADMSYAESKKKEKGYNPNWFLVGYGYSQNVGNSWSPTGPVKFTFGGTIWKFISMELTADTSWLYWNGYANNRTYKNTSWSFDLKPYFLISQSIGNKSNALIPYVGIAPLISVSGVDYKDNYMADKASFDIGVAAKGGIRVKFINYLMLGAGIEYVYHTNNLPAYRNMSHFNAIFEAGITW